MRTTSTRRLLVVAGLLAVACLLALPGPAAAGVRARYKTEYAGKLAGYAAALQAQAARYANNRDASAMLADTMAGMVDDPEKHDELVAHENFALGVYNQGKTLPQRAFLVYSKNVNTFKSKAKRYFASAAQQRAFKRRCDQLKSYGSMMVLLAMEHAYGSWAKLGIDPPALDLAAQEIAAGDEDLAAGQTGSAAALAALRRLL